MKQIVSRLGQGSTWATLAAAFGTLAATAPATAGPYLWSAMAVSTVLGIVLSDASKPTA